MGGSDEKKVDQPTRVLTPQQLADYAAWSNYTAGPEPTGPLAEFQGLSGGDYNRLEEQIYKPQEAAILEERKRLEGDVNRLAGDRGLSSSEPARLQAQTQFVSEPTTRALLAARGGAATSRYGLQSQELGQKNIYNQYAYEAPWQRWAGKKQAYYGGKAQYGGGGYGQKQDFDTGFRWGI
ncbi:MAG: hypothetical protein V2A77_02160 [Pseudomonadota bacterium]